MSIRGYRVDAFSRERLVDQLVEAYVDWRQACARVDDAYRFCAGVSGARARVAFALYVAAQCAEVYAVLVRRADALAWNEDSPAEPLGGPTGGVGWP
jgi:hypothetical protein